MKSELKREWKPLSQARLKAIIEDTVQDNPAGDHCNAEIYRLAMEVAQARKEARKNGKKVTA